MLASPELAAVLDSFPAVESAFGYGSGVFRQPGLYLRGKGKPMLDFIFAVQSPVVWHQRARLQSRRVLEKTYWPPTPSLGLHARPVSMYH